MKHNGLGTAYPLSQQKMYHHSWTKVFCDTLTLEVFFPPCTVATVLYGGRMVTGVHISLSLIQCVSAYEVLILKQQSCSLWFKHACNGVQNIKTKNDHQKQFNILYIINMPTDNSTNDMSSKNDHQKQFNILYIMNMPTDNSTNDMSRSLVLRVPIPKSCTLVVTILSAKPKLAKTTVQNTNLSCNCKHNTNCMTYQPDI